MRQTLPLIAVVALLGCGKKTTPAEPETNAEPKVAAKKPEPPKTEPKAVAKIPTNAFVNTLGMPFVPVPGTDVQFCIWETRVKDYAAYAAANAGVDGDWKKPTFLGESFTQEDTHPVVKVSRNEGQAFCEWLTKKELAEGKITAGQKYRLPTDTEWSVAVGLSRETGATPKAKDGGGGIEGVYPWGKEWPPPRGAGNYADTALKTQFGPKYKTVAEDDIPVIEGYTDGFANTSPVGSFAANQHGLHDLGGNVSEWCEDWYDPAAKNYRVLRGANWFVDYPDFLLSSYRDPPLPGQRKNTVGFRCVLVGGSGG